MKKIMTILLALMLTLCLCACNQPGSIFYREFVFPEGSRIAGLDMTGETKESAWSKLEAAAGDYALELTVDGIPVRISGEDIDLTCSREAFMAAADRLEAGEDANFSQVVRFSGDKLLALLDQNLNRPAVDAVIVYDEASGQYLMEPHTEGLKTECGVLALSLQETVCTLTPELTLYGIVEFLSPTWSADAPQTQAALEQINKMIGVELSYAFSTSQSGEPHEIPAETLLSFVSLGNDGFTPTINQDVLDAYVSELSDIYSLTSITGPFQTTGGSTINLKVYDEGLYVDTAALAQDIVTCMQEGISETRTAPFLDTGIRDLAHGGTYIEVNLSAQHLWFYKNGELLVSTPFVSGCVAEDMCSPTGIYKIYGKSSDLYLVGPTWRDWVSYWMPFYGGYGLHDATWRDEFGGDIYLYEGSHGCINLPLEAAGIIYNNASIGTRVVLYGGESSVPPLPQELIGTTSYDIADDTKPFQLDIAPKYKEPKLTYESDNPEVATVSKNGTVTVKGTGTAKIKVSAPAYSFYTEAETIVTVNVHTACEEGRHTMGKPTVLEEPTCQPGLQEAVCTKCDYREETVVEPSKAHKFGQWITVREPSCSEEGSQERTCTLCEKETEAAVLPKTDHLFEDGPVCTLCGAENPDYIQPSEEETEPSE